MHRNPWWLTPKGETLDAGAFVVGLEFATGQVGAHARQAVAGRLSPGRRRPRRGPRRARAPAADFAMVGDDPRADVAAAQRVGLRGILVLSGKTSRGTSTWSGARARRSRRGRGPDAIAPTLADVVAALD